MENNFKNYGVILGHSETTYLGGTIPYEIRNPSGDWTPYLPVGEKQAGKEDWMDCVSRSLTSSVEIQEKFLTKAESNYCDREIAKGSGTTVKGNRLDLVAEYARTTGLGQQTTYPDSGGTWDEQYAPIPADIQLKLGVEKLKWLENWDIKYEVIGFDKKSLKYHLQQAPLQLVIPGHAVVGILSKEFVDTIFDSYIPYVKDIPGVNYPSSPIYAMKIVLYKKEDALDSDMLLVDLQYGDKGSGVLKLRRALKRLGWQSDQASDMYNDELVNVVWNYSLANLTRYGWSWWWHLFYYKGRMVDGYIRESINNNLKVRK